MFFILLFWTAQAWWCTAHMTIAMISYYQLLSTAPQVLQKAESILSPLYGSLTHGLSNTFVDSACWSDDLGTYGFHALQLWHYIDQPYNPQGLLNTQATNINILYALENVVHTLNGTDSTNSPFETAFMMRWLIHLSGDIHQPLHTVALWNREFTRSDYGGNLFYIKFNDNIVELHALWDAVLGYMQYLVPRPLDVNSWKMIEEQAGWATGNYSRADLAELLKENDRSEWVRFNFHLAMDYAYGGIEQHEKPSEEYIKKGYEIAQRQLALAGYRLTDLLKSLLSQDLN